MSTQSTIVIRSQFSFVSSQTKIDLVFTQLGRQSVNLAAFSVKSDAKNLCKKNIEKTTAKIVVGPSTTNDEAANFALTAILLNLEIKFKVTNIIQQLPSASGIGVPGFYSRSFRALTSSKILIKYSYLGEGNGISIVGFFWSVKRKDLERATIVLALA